MWYRYSKKIAGWQAGTRATAWDSLQVVEMELQQQFPDGDKERGLCLMSDNGCQLTGKAFTPACKTLGITQVFTSNNSPKGNANTEWLMRTLKEELLWLGEWPGHPQLKQGLADWVEHDNEAYHHSALSVNTPRQFEEDYQRSHLTQFVAD